MKTLCLFLLLVASIVFSSCDDYKLPPSPYAHIETLAAFDISVSGATLNARLTYLRATPLTDHGFFLSLSENTSPSSPKISLGPTSEKGEFKFSSSDLEPNTRYFVKPYVFDGTVYVYGDVLAFETK